MKTNEAQAKWNGKLKDGNGTINLESVEQEFSFTFSSRFGEGKGTNPEELIAAAHSGCFSMAFSNVLAEAGYEPKSIKTIAQVTVEQEGEAFRIAKSELKTDAEVPGIEKEKFEQLAEEAKVNCPVSQALSSLKITIQANLNN